MCSAGKLPQNASSTDAPKSQRIEAKELDVPPCFASAEMWDAVQEISRQRCFCGSCFRLACALCHDVAQDEALTVSYVDSCSGHDIRPNDTGTKREPCSRHETLHYSISHPMQAEDTDRYTD